MATVTDSTGQRRKQRNYAIAALVLAGSAGGAYLVWGLQRPPQMGADEELFRCVDALFTAVTSRDEQRLADCERRLAQLKNEGRIPVEASTYLDGVIRKATAGRWESAAQTLYDFMRAQRREKRGA